MPVKPKSSYYFIQKGRRGLVAAFPGHQPLRLNAGFEKRVTLKRISPEFEKILQNGFTMEEKLVAGKMIEILAKNEKISYDELFSRVASAFSKIGLKLGKNQINMHSAMQLYKKLANMKAIVEERQVQKAGNN